MPVRIQFWTSPEVHRGAKTKFWRPNNFVISRQSSPISPARTQLSLDVFGNLSKQSLRSNLWHYLLTNLTETCELYYTHLS